MDVTSKGGILCSKPSCGKLDNHSFTGLIAHIDLVFTAVGLFFTAVGLFFTGLFTTDGCWPFFHGCWPFMAAGLFFMAAGLFFVAACLFFMAAGSFSQWLWFKRFQDLNQILDLSPDVGRTKRQCTMQNCGEHVWEDSQPLRMSVPQDRTQC